MTGLIEESTVILWEINQSISPSGISREKYFKRNHIMSLNLEIKMVKRVTERLVCT